MSDTVSEWKYAGADPIWASSFKQPTIEEAIHIDLDFWGTPADQMKRRLIYFGPGDFRSLIDHESVDREDFAEFSEAMEKYEHDIFAEFVDFDADKRYMYLALVDEDGNFFIDREQGFAGVIISWGSKVKEPLSNERAFDPDLSFVEHRAIIALWARHRGFIDADDLVREMQLLQLQPIQIRDFIRSFRPDTIDFWGSIESNGPLIPKD
jgi:hypothetical protein